MSPLGGLQREEQRQLAGGIVREDPRSGHRTASVLLNTYLGVMRDDLATSVARTETALAEALLRRKA